MIPHKIILAAMFVLGTSPVLGATVSIVPGNPTVQVGDTFSVTVEASDFPETGGATLGLSFNPAVIHLTNLSLAPGAPFDMLVPTSIDNVAGKVDYVTFLAPLFGALPSGNFSVLDLSFLAVGLGTSPIQLIDDGSIKSWTGTDFQSIQGLIYYQSLATVQPVPLPASVWLFVSGIGVLFGARLKRGSTCRSPHPKI